MNKDIKQSWFSQIAQYVMYVFFVLFPFTNTSYFLYGGTSVRSIALILIMDILMVLFAVWIFKKDQNITIPKSWIFLSLVIYFVSMTISSFFGLNFSVSFWSAVTRTSGLWYLFHLGAFLYILWILLLNQKRHNTFIFLIIASTSLFSLLAFFGPEGLGWLFKGYKSDGFTFGNSSFAAMYIFGAFLLSLYYIFQAESKKWWMYVFPLLLIINPYVIDNHVWFGNFSRIIGEARLSTFVMVLATVGLLAFWLISKIKNKKIFSRVSYGIFGVYVIGVMVCSISLLSSDGFLRKEYLNQATAARPLVWAISEKAISDRPLLGWGSDNFERVFEKYYDNRLLEETYGSEAWFDRSHNIFLEQIVNNGFIGLTFYLLVYVVILISLLYVFVNTTDKKDRIFASILFVYFSLHLAELQTVFDTTISYVMLGFMFVSAVVLYGRTRTQKTGKSQKIVIGGIPKYIISVAVIFFCFWSLVWGVIPFVRAQNVNGYIRTIGFAEKRIPFYPVLFSSPVDLHAFLWRTSTDFERGISENPKILTDSAKVTNLKKEVLIFENEYRLFVANNPTHFRAKLSFADILIYQALFGENKLEEAQKVLDEAIVLVPTSPQPYWMKAVAYLYMKKFDLAKETAKKGLAINPNIEYSKMILEYVESSIKTFPEINLFFFRLI